MSASDWETSVRMTKALLSLLNHRSGLNVFVDRSEVPEDNNAAERALRGPVVRWTSEMREKNLPPVVENPRFLVLLWIVIPSLGSDILSFVRQQLPDDWTERYNVALVLIKTFVETPRLAGALYRASASTRLGTAQGQG